MACLTIQFIWDMAYLTMTMYVGYGVFNDDNLYGIWRV